MASEAFRYQVTRDPAARASAWDLFRGMQFLVNVCEEGGGGWIEEGEMTAALTVPSARRSVLVATMSQLCWCMCMIYKAF